MLVGFGTTLILVGLNAPFGRLLLAFVTAAPVSVILGFFMAIVAENQISAAGATKLIMPAYLTIPLISIFLPLRWQWVFFPFPNYWMFLSFRSLFIDTPQVLDYGPSALITAGSGMVVVLLLVPRLRNKLHFRSPAVKMNSSIQHQI
jgi:hypothetical protein